MKSDDLQIQAIIEHATLKNVSEYRAITHEEVDRVEKALGFPLPDLLRNCFVQFQNGGFGPGYGVIGIGKGYASDYGDLFGTYTQLKNGQESEGITWKPGMLPFCEWGCNIFSFVDCLSDNHQIYLFEDFELKPLGFGLDDFFKRWIAGGELRKKQARKKAVITNPFTGKSTIVEGAKED